MDINLIDSLENAGVDTKSALQRFAENKTLYIRFMYRFLEDENYKILGTALQAEDWESMLFAAHTLKGVAGNLGMDRLFQACTATVALLRQEDWLAAKESFGELEEAYNEICSVLHQSEGGTE